jgi:uncharacterized protein
MDDRVESPKTPSVPEALLRSVVERLKPRRVILFGSRATGHAQPDSDWDLLVVVDDDAPNESIGWRSLHEARRGFHGAVDILACRESSFQDRRDIVGSLPWIAVTDGIVVYDRHDAN